MTESGVTRIKRILDVAVSVSLICVSIALIAIAIRYLREPQPARSGQLHDSLKKGQLLELASLRQPYPKGNLLLIALQSGCRFCKESIPLYRTLLSESNRINAKIVFVFAEPLPNARAYIAEHGLTGAEYRQADFGSIHVQGTPTVILVDGQNRVTDYWIGKLQTDRIADLDKALGLPKG